MLDGGDLREPVKQEAAKLHDQAEGEDASVHTDAAAADRGETPDAEDPEPSSRKSQAWEQIAGQAQRVIARLNDADAASAAGEPSDGLVASA